MAFMEWKDDYSVGVNVIDQQHRKLVWLVNELYEAMRAGRASEAVGDVLKGLIQYTVVHFDTEEKYMQAHSYPYSLGHKREHEDFKIRAQDFNRQFQNGKLTVPLETSRFLKEWLDMHILGTDKRLGAFLGRKGVA